MLGSSEVSPNTTEKPEERKSEGEEDAYKEGSHTVDPSDENEKVDKGKKGKRKKQENPNKSGKGVKKIKNKKANKDIDDATPEADVDVIKEVRAVDFCEVTNSIMAYCVWMGWPQEKDHTWEPLENLDEDSCECSTCDIFYNLPSPLRKIQFQLRKTWQKKEWQCKNLQMMLSGIKI